MASLRPEKGREEMSILSKILVTLLCSCKSAEATAELRKIIRHFRDAATEAADEFEDEIKPIVRSSRTSSRGSKRRYTINQFINESIFLHVKFKLRKKTRLLTEMVKVENIFLNICSLLIYILQSIILGTGADPEDQVLILMDQIQAIQRLNL